jgi:HlyD family secretion protein
MGELAAAWRGGRWRGGRRRWVWIAAAAVVVALIVYGVVHALTAGASTKPAAPALATVDTGAVTTEVATTGTLQPSQTRSLSFPVAGTVDTVEVTAGSTVTSGQVLARVDDTDAAAAVDTDQDALTQAEDALDTAESNAAKASSTSGQASTCAAANVPAAYHPTPTPTPSATPTPKPTVTPRPTASPTRPSTPTKPSAPRSSSPARGGCSQNGQGQSGGQGQNSGGDAIYSAQERVNQARVTLENAEQALDGTTIKAPIAGRILSVAGKVGAQVSSGSTFITLVDVSPMQISAAFPEADADHLAVGQKAVVTLASQPGADLKATVIQVDPTGTSDGTLVRYGVLLSFDSAPKDLLVGQSAAVRVTTGSAAGALRVPSTAVHNVAGSTGTVLTAGAPVKVGVGLRGDQYTQITSGLVAGDRVVRSW